MCAGWDLKLETSKFTKFIMITIKVISYEIEAKHTSP